MKKKRHVCPLPYPSRAEWVRMQRSLFDLIHERDELTSTLRALALQLEYEQRTKGWRVRFSTSPLMHLATAILTRHEAFGSASWHRRVGDTNVRVMRVLRVSK
jgi:hypothetical protein